MTGQTVGSDRVLFKDGDLIIYSPYDMDGWQVTKYRKAAIFFEDRTYFLVRKSKLPDGTFHYRLRLWQEDHVDFPSKGIHYNEEYVAERNVIYHKVEKIKKISMLMVPIQPLLGFLPSRLKEILQEKYGVDPVTATGYSIFLEYLFAALISHFFVIHVFTQVFPPWFNYSPIVVILVLADALIRYNDILKEIPYPYGFYEWLFKLQLK